ncbi:MAG: histidine kinase N-terminal 7TM domain-containing protein [Candidatus Buchananbacteria bacterium]
MIISSLFPLISAVFVLALGLFVLRRDYSSRINLSFFLFCIAIMVWMFGTFMMFVSSNNIAMASFWDRFVYLGVVFIPAVALDFALALTKNSKRNLKYWLMIVGYVLSCIFLPLIFTSNFTSGVFVYEWGVYTKAQVFHNLFMLYFVSYIILFFATVINFYFKSAQALEKLQIKYILLAFLVLAIFGSLGFLPAYGIAIYPVSYLFGMFFVLIMAYAILKYRFMDIRTFARTTFIYLVDSVYAYGFYSFLIVVYGYLWGTVYTSYSLVAGIFVGPAFVATLFAIDKWILKFSNKYLFHALYDDQMAIIRLIQEINKYTDLNDIMDLVLGKIQQTMDLSKAGILLIHYNLSYINYEVAKVIGFNKTELESLVADNFLSKSLSVDKKPFVKEEIDWIAKNSPKAKKLMELKGNMEKIGASLCLPLVASNRLIGLIILGSKKGKEAYTNQDLDLLATLNYQAATAIDNAILYKKVNEFNKNLKAKVDEQTKDLQDRAVSLEKLLLKRTDFMYDVSNQLKAPVSVIRSTISMLEGSINKLSPKEQQKFQDMTVKVDVLNQIYKDILGTSKADKDRVKFDYLLTGALSVDKIVGSVIHQLTPEAKAKGIDLQLIKPKERLPVLTASDFLEQAIYNLLDNTIKYTRQGSVRISLMCEKLNVIVKVETPTQDLKAIFDKVVRGANTASTQSNIPGRGFFVAQKIIEARGGKIMAESQGSKGTAFVVSLPYLIENLKVKQ